jgi:hypothetical protein
VETPIKSNAIPETTEQVVDNSPVEEVLSTSSEQQKPINQSRRSARKTQVSFANDSARLNGDPVEQVPSVADTSVPFVQPSVHKLPPKNVAAKRLLASRIMSTPIRNVPVDDVSFQIRDVDLSNIHLPDHENNQADSLPELESTPKRKSKRRRCN